jgi:hypothetical protein
MLKILDENKTLEETVLRSIAVNAPEALILNLDPGG